MPPGRKRKDLTGERVGLLTYVRPTGRDCSYGTAMWLVKCDCGNTREIPVLNRMNKYSCGCKSKIEVIHEQVMERLKAGE